MASALPALFARHRVLRVPKVHPAYSSRRVLTSSWEAGLRLDAWLKARPYFKRSAIASGSLTSAAAFRHGIFNADPHPVNYLFRSDGRLVILDYGCVPQLSGMRVAAFLRLRDAVHRGDQDMVRHALQALGARDPGDGDR